MIAPYRDTDEAPPPTEALRRARRAVYAALFEDRPQAQSAAGQTPSWQAWLVTGWMMVVAACFLAKLLGPRN